MILGGFVGFGAHCALVVRSAPKREEQSEEGFLVRPTAFLFGGRSLNKAPNKDKKRRKLVWSTCTNFAQCNFCATQFLRKAIFFAQIKTLVMKSANAERIGEEGIGEKEGRCDGIRRTNCSFYEMEEKGGQGRERREERKVPRPTSTSKS